MVTYRYAILNFVRSQSGDLVFEDLESMGLTEEIVLDEFGRHGWRVIRASGTEDSARYLMEFRDEYADRKQGHDVKEDIIATLANWQPF